MKYLKHSIENLLNNVVEHRTSPRISTFTVLNLFCLHIAEQRPLEGSPAVVTILRERFCFMLCPDPPGFLQSHLVGRKKCRGWMSLRLTDAPARKWTEAAFLRRKVQKPAARGRGAGEHLSEKTSSGSPPVTGSRLALAWQQISARGGKINLEENAAWGKVLLALLKIFGFSPTWNQFSLSSFREKSFFLHSFWPKQMSQTKIILFCYIDQLVDFYQKLEKKSSEMH